MSIATFSNVAGDVIRSYGKTAIALIDGYRAGGSYVLRRVDQGWARTLNRRATRLDPILRQRLIDAEKQLIGYYGKGLASLSAGSTKAVQTVVDAAGAGVKRLAGSAARLEGALGRAPISAAAGFAMPLAQVTRDAASQIADRAANVAARIETGTAVRRAKPAKAAKAAKRMSRAVQSRAAAQSKRAVKAVRRVGRG